MWTTACGESLTTSLFQHVRGQGCMILSRLIARRNGTRSKPQNGRKCDYQNLMKSAPSTFRCPCLPLSQWEAQAFRCFRLPLPLPPTISVGGSDLPLLPPSAALASHYLSGRQGTALTHHAGTTTNRKTESTAALHIFLVPKQQTHGFRSSSLRFLSSSSVAAASFLFCSS